MKAKTWMVVGMAVLCLASLIGWAQAQPREHSGSEPAVVGSERFPIGEAVADAEAPGDDEVDFLLAADDAGGGDDDATAAEHGGMGGPGHRMRRGPGAMGLGELRNQLNLTDEQRSRLADIRDRQARAAIPIQSDLRLAGLDMRKLMRADRPDRQAIDRQIDRIASLRAQLQKSRLNGMLDARAVLSPAQQKLLRELRGGMGAGMGGRRGGRPMEMMDDPMTHPRR